MAAREGSMAAVVAWHVWNAGSIWIWIQVLVRASAWVLLKQLVADGSFSL